MILQPPRPRHPALGALLAAPPPPPQLAVLPPPGPAVPPPGDDPLPYLQGLYRLLPPEQVQRLLDQTGKAEQRRRLPAASVVWLVIRRGLFPQPPVPKVWRAFHPSAAEAEPTDAAFSQARRRLGVPPLRQAFDLVAQPLATPATRGACYRGWRLVGWDGTVLDVPDTPANARAFGRPGHAKGQGAFPQLRLLPLCELGTHAVFAAQVKLLRCQEVSRARTLVRRLRPGMLLLGDRAFLDRDLVDAVRGRGAHVLARVKANQLGRRLRDLPDGSYPAALHGHRRAGRKAGDDLVVRVVEYTHDDSHRPGCGEVHRLMTTVLDPAALPASDMPLLYHERWEQELALDEIKAHLNGRPVPLRSKTPAGVVQEVYGLLLAHYVIRAVMHEAAQAEAVDPDRLSFTGALWVVRHQLHEVTAKGPARWYAELVEEVRRQELRPRRQRWYPRVLKKTQADYPKKRAEHNHPPQPTKCFADAVVLLSSAGATAEPGKDSG